MERAVGFEILAGWLEVDVALKNLDNVEFLFNYFGGGGSHRVIANSSTWLLPSLEAMAGKQDKVDSESFNSVQDRQGRTITRI